MSLPANLPPKDRCSTVIIETIKNRGKNWPELINCELPDTKDGSKPTVMTFTGTAASGTASISPSLLTSPSPSPSPSAEV